jgi:EKC/KEOPS complex subunit CGI121/TPRKB
MAEFELDTHPGRRLHLLLFVDVKNSRGLVQAMQAGTLVPELAFFNASLVPDTFPVLAAAHKAVLSQTRGSLVTRTLHSELIYNYSGSKHVSFFFTILSWLQQNMYPPLGITHKKS